MTDVDAVKIIRSGGVLIYPTETLFALGADASDEGAANRVALVKGRPVSKPLPLVIGSMDQLDLVTKYASPEVLKLAKSFWPGPLSILVKAREELSYAVKDSRGYTSVRWTDHPVAAKICLESSTPLIATSANLSGKKAAEKFEDIDEELINSVEGVFNGKPAPRGGSPSTVVEPLSNGKVRVLRDGVISRATLMQAGFIVVD
ncbi:L-threonylcarbamoyladenylate synthase [Maridesulfovibrio ferrireducens]|uniref:L-threonylcarbamoyladenylate synthase n=1 Tax=Maridesulfovibrio ferrireducens TaxID=246191 RepID=A0A1G9JCB1_9BACT|nr:L-threonylcarbamoyladenylate synthase [Maridesulfovibrio ferrireducens]SDL35031.1 L-threonylcarbamoyladenylate synthase [Maridesulfovibrio ferrireducens]